MSRESPGRAGAAQGTAWGCGECPPRPPRLEAPSLSLPGDLRAEGRGISCRSFPLSALPVLHPGLPPELGWRPRGIWDFCWLRSIPSGSSRAGLDVGEVPRDPSAGGNCSALAAAPPSIPNTGIRAASPSQHPPDLPWLPPWAGNRRLLWFSGRNSAWKRGRGDSLGSGVNSTAELLLILLVSSSTRWYS